MVLTSLDPRWPTGVFKACKALGFRRTGERMSIGVPAQPPNFPTELVAPTGMPRDVPRYLQN